MSTETKKKRFDYRHIICIVVTLGCAACTVFLFPNALGRIIEGVRDLGVSVAYYFCGIFGFKDAVMPTVNRFPVVPFFPFLAPNTAAPSVPIPETFIGFKAKWGAYWRLFITKNNLFGYVAFLGKILVVLLSVIAVIVPVILLIRAAFGRFLNLPNNDYNKDSKPLRAFKTFARRLTPVKAWTVSLLEFIRARRGYWVAWLCVWLFNFNVFTIGLEFFAYLFYFAVSFDLFNIYRQVYKLFYDLSVPFSFLPWWVWCIVALFLINRCRKNIAYSRLNHLERCNRGFINDRPIVTMVCGTMGKGKTTLITDIALSEEILLRDKAYELLLQNDLKFPCFPWINFENSLKAAIEKHSVYNLATCKRFVRSKRRKFFRRIMPYRCFGYDFDRYGMTYDNKLYVSDLWQVLESYAQLYFIYMMQSSLLVANYSIRTDMLLNDLGNFPRWDSDFFKRDSRLIDSFSRHAHILDFDMLRLGRKVLESNPNKDAFEFGVVAITEVGKERGNMVELQGVKKTADETNQKNDLFNTALKMIRHPATVDGFPFVKVITDEQRPSSWGADARELTEIVYIRKTSDRALALPLFSPEEFLYLLFFGKFRAFYSQYRFLRGDNTLTMHLIKSLCAKLNRYYNRTYNLFSYKTLSVQIESGTMDGQYNDGKYYLMSKKIYSKRFSTDCYSEFFAEKSLRSPVGLDDLPEYETEKATFGELQQQKSYFVDGLPNLGDKQ